MKRRWGAFMASLAIGVGVGFGCSQAKADFVPASADIGCNSSGNGHFSPPTESPQWVADDNRDPSDVVQFYLHGSLELLDSIFVGQGWTEALRKNLRDDLMYGGSVLLGINWVIQRMPVSMERLCGEKMIAAYELHNHPFGGRRHFRVYYVGGDDQGRSVWAISASRDTGIEFDPDRPNQLFLNHRVERDEDYERERVLWDLENADAIASINTLTLAPTGFGPHNGAYSADGVVYDIVIK